MFCPNDANTYVLDSLCELERLCIQARVWESEAEMLLKLIKLQSISKCIDLGCGAIGILGPLSRRAGGSGQVIGIDIDPRQLIVADAYRRVTGLTNVELLERDAFQTHLPRQSFDLVHARFLFAPAGRNDDLLTEILDLTRPGGVIAIQEPDASSWNLFPRSQAWNNLIETILAVFKLGGGDFNVGRETFGMLQRAGAEDVQVRSCVKALHNEHPYMRLPIQFAQSLRERILSNGLMSGSELDETIAQCEVAIKAPDALVTSFSVVQVWGRKPKGADLL